MKYKKRQIVCMVLGVILAMTCGASLDFHPCLGNELIVREIQFCTFIICVVMAICTAIIVDSIEEKKIK